MGASYIYNDTALATAGEPFSMGGPPADAEPPEGARWIGVLEPFSTAVCAVPRRWPWSKLERLHTCTRRAYAYRVDDPRVQVFP